MYTSNPVARNLGRCSTTIVLGLLVLSCGGGGAVLEPDQTPAPGNPSSPGAPPAAPPGSPASAPPAPPAAPPAPGRTSPTVISTAGSRFNPATVTIQAGGEVTWQIVESTHNVTFGANKPQAGDVPNTSPAVSVTRVFPTAGTFDYECTRHSGMTGQVIVQSTTTPAPPAAPPPAPAPAPPAAPTAPPPPPAMPAPTAVVTTPGNAFSPEEVEFAPGGTVTWQFSGTTHNVTFRDLAPPGGNIPNSAPGTSASRTFPVEGDYDYFCSIHDGMKGRIRVH